MPSRRLDEAEPRFRDTLGSKRLLCTIFSWLVMIPVENAPMLAARHRGCGEKGEPKGGKQNAVREVKRVAEADVRVV